MRRLGWLGGLIAVSALMFSGCTTASASSNSELLAALNIMDSVGFHDIDEGLRATPQKLEASWLGKTKNARIAVAATTWPKELKPMATAFVDSAGKLQEALEKDDKSGAVAPAKAVHEAQHELSHEAYSYLATKAGLATKHNDGH